MNKNHKKITTYFVLFSLLLIGIIYAILQANLQINGIAKIKANSWDIHFDNVQINENSVSIGTGDSAATIDPENNCKVDFSVTLSLPGDFYEFTVDAVNDGSIDAMIDSTNNTFQVDGVDSDIPDYLNYSVTYFNGVAIEPKHKLAHNSTETYLVRVEYKTDIEELPSASTLTMSMEIIYVQADETATIVPFSLYNVFKTEADSNSGLVHEYTGDHKDSFTKTGTEKIYHWYASSNDNANTILDKWNVFFGGFCWQMWRTTDTGGVKLIYNGVISNIYDQVTLNQNDYSIVSNTGNFIWNSETSTWNATITDGQSKEISFTVPAGDGYSFIMTGTTGSSTGGGFYIYKDDVKVLEHGGGGGQSLAANQLLGTLTSSNVIKMIYSGTSTVESPITFQIKILKNGVLLDIGCDNIGMAQQIGTSVINSNSRSPAYVGYMIPNSSKIKNYNYGVATRGSLFGTGVTYDGSNYTLTNTSTTYDTTHHYTCNDTIGSCPIVRYYFHSGDYIELNGEEDAEEALNNMLKSNDNNSTLKNAIDTWYRDNMTTYTSKLEDTIFCNDRSISSLGGWNPNGGSTSDYLKFKNFILNSDLSCINITDQFSMSNTSAQLLYPIGLMTSSEANLLNNNTLRNTLQAYWLASPYYFDIRGYAGSCAVHSDGSLTNYLVYGEAGIRPVISLKPGTMATSGDGSRLNPYVVE